MGKTADIKTDLDKNNNTESSLLNEDTHVPLWSPKITNINQNTKLKEFQNLIEKKFNQKFGIFLKFFSNKIIIYKKNYQDSYDDFYKWTIQNFTNFWEEFWNFSKIVHSVQYKQVMIPYWTYY